MRHTNGVDMGVLRDGASLSRGQILRMVVVLSLPTILAEISSIVMQYIDTAMVGGLGANASASIGIVQSTTWLTSGLCTCAAAGFTVQIAQLLGAGKQNEARGVLKQAIVVLLAFSLVVTLASAAVSGRLPAWLGAEEAICADASAYFLIYSCALPVLQLERLCTGTLQCSGDTRTPSIINVAMCLFDVCFNALFIFEPSTLRLGALSIPLPGLGMGVAGAALGTAMAEAVAAALILWITCARSPVFGLHLGGSWRLRRRCLLTACKVAGPMCFERVVMCGAQIASTVIVAPLGTVSIAANSLAVTAESICYMPGYGVGSASTALVGQSFGAGRRDLAKRFAWFSVGLGMGIMACTGALLYLFAPAVMAMLTPVEEVRALGTEVLRIEAFAEPLFAASIVGAGALRGAGDTLVPSIMNLASMWGVRITLSALLAPHVGLRGVWIAMCTELCIRGVLYLVRVGRGRWLDRADFVTR